MLPSPKGDVSFCSFYHLLVLYKSIGNSNGGQYNEKDSIITYYRFLYVLHDCMRWRVKRDVSVGGSNETLANSSDNELVTTEAPAAEITSETTAEPTP